MAALSLALATLIATASAADRATPQGGILEGGNPTVYSASNPIILFIIQVRRLFLSLWNIVPARWGPCMISV
jgi:hypothetical protein